MGKRMDITDKLSFDENPVIVVKGKEIEVNTDASTVLKLLEMIETAENDTSDKTVSASMIAEMAGLLFTKSGKKTLDSLKLNISDYSTVVETAMELATNSNDEGEPQESDGTTSSETGI